MIPRPIGYVADPFGENESRVEAGVAGKKGEQGALGGRQLVLGDRLTAGEAQSG